MKKVLLTFMALVAMITVSNAQTKLGLRAGVNWAELRAVVDDYTSTSDSKIGMDAGAFVTLPISANFSIQPEVSFSMEGGKDKQGGEKISLTYFNVPLLLQYHGSDFTVESGLQMGFLLAAKAVDGGVSANVKEAFQSTNLSWAFGIGYRLAHDVGLHVRCNLGLSNIIRQEPGLEGKMKSNVAQLHISIPLKTRSAVK